LKFKAGILGGRFVGVCGGFKRNAPEPCGHIFSDLRPCREAGAQSGCIAIAEKISAYWWARARDLGNSP